MVCNYVLKPDRIGGMDRFFIAYDAAAKEKGYEVTWFFSDYKPFDFYKDLTIFSAKGTENVEVYFLDHLKKNQQKYDILITHFTSLCSSFYKNVKTVSSIKTSVVVDHNPRPLNGFPIKKQIKNRLKGIVYHKYIDLFVGVSQYTVDNIIKDLGNQVATKTSLVYNGIDTKVFKKRVILDQQSELLNLIVVSHLRYSKGIQDLLAALGLLSEEDKERVKVDIYGEGPMKELLKKQMEDEKIEQIISFKGSSSAIPQLLCKYDYLIQPTYMECFSLSILESLSANVPVITTTVGGNPEIIENDKNGFLFKAKDIHALSNILKGLVNGQIKINESTNQLIEQEYTLARMLAEHLQILDQCT